MNKNISEEIIEIGDKEYTLFLNRTGIVNWEKMTKLASKVTKYQNLVAEIEEDNVEIADDANPFEIYDEKETEKLNKELEEMIDVYAKFYWVALYTHHKLSITEAKEVFDKAIEEYGIEQLAELANKMLKNANENHFVQERKNLKALKSTKKN